jgi:hypothetical protein
LEPDSMKFTIAVTLIVVGAFAALLVVYFALRKR